MIVLMAGLPGTGKSTLARALAERTVGALVSKDQIRASIFAPADVEYSAAQDDFVMEIMLEAALYLLRKDAGRTIFLDGRTFSRLYQIERVLQFVRSVDQPWVILECTCSAECARRRLASDTSHPAQNRDFALYLKVQSRFEPITYPKTVIGTEQPLDRSVDQAMAAIEAATRKVV
jgi:predicted kinase